MRFDLARREDDPEIRRLLRENPLDGAVRLSLEVEPDSARAAAVQGPLHQVVVARNESDGRLVAMGSRAVRTVFADGEPMRVGYLSQLRVDRDHRRRPGLVRRGYARLRELHADGAADFYVTTIVSDNVEARRLFEANLPGLPTYRELEPFVTLVLPVGRMPGGRGVQSREPGLAVEPASAGDLAEVVDCLRRNFARFDLAPAWTRSELLSDVATRDLAPGDFRLARRDGRLVGCAALWRQGFKQAVVRGYERRLAWSRPALNLVAGALGRPRLPAPGRALRSAFVSHVAVDGDDPAVFLALLDAVRRDAAAARIDYLSLGFSRRHPLFPAAASVAHREYESIVYLVHWDDGADRARRVGRRVPHLEVAVL